MSSFTFLSGSPDGFFLVSMLSFFLVVFFIVGACLGSFLSVCLYRIPLGQSIVKPRSFCPSCSKAIPFYYNIPIIAYLFTRARCFSCKVRIPIRYFLLELGMGIMTCFSFLWFAFHFGFYLSLIYLYLFFLFVLIICLKDHIEKIPKSFFLVGIIALLFFYFSSYQYLFYYWSQLPFVNIFLLLFIVLFFVFKPLKDLFLVLLFFQSFLFGGILAYVFTIILVFYPSKFPIAKFLKPKLLIQFLFFFI